jgi:hypothetical protein
VRIFIREVIFLDQQRDVVVIVLYTEGWVCDVALIEYTLGPGKPKKGWDFGKEGTRGQWGTKGVSLRATWD